MYTVKISSLEESTPTMLGQYLPSMLAFESDEEVIMAVPTTDYSGNLIFCFRNGKVAKVTMQSYNKAVKKMTKAFNTDYPLIGCYEETDNEYIRLDSKQGKRVIYNVKSINAQASRTTKGVQVMKLKSDDRVTDFLYINEKPEMVDRYLIKSAGAGKLIKIEDAYAFV